MHRRDLAALPFAVPALRRAVCRLAARRGWGLALLYHRVEPPRTGAGVVPAVPPDLFAAQLGALAAHFDLVTVDRLLERPPWPRPRVAVTFDDDDPSISTHGLGVLERASIPFTCFLSGRSIVGMGAYWWQWLEQAVDERGVHDVAERLGLDATGLDDLAAACEQARAGEGAIAALTTRGEPAVLSRAEISAIADTGAEVGFHTAAHPVLPGLGRDDLVAALHDGRAELEREVGRPARFFAYPHGRHDAATVSAVKECGYEAAFTTTGHRVDRASGRWTLSRWEAGPVEPAALVAAVCLRLLRPARPLPGAPLR